MRNTLKLLGMIIFILCVVFAITWDRSIITAQSFEAREPIQQNNKVKNASQEGKRGNTKEQNTAKGKSNVGFSANDDKIEVGNEYFIARELIGAPTDSSITVKAIARKDLEVCFEYGTDPENYSNRTDVIVFKEGIPLETLINNLNQDTEYYYRMLYRYAGEKEFIKGEEYNFHTQRKQGSPFVFTIQADSHRDENTNFELYRRALQNILKDNPDFNIDLGDTFMTEKFAKTREEVEKRYLDERSYFDMIDRTIPLFLVTGNHEGENGWRLNGKADNQAVWASNARNRYYMNPIPGGFYSGKDEEESFVGVRRSYYSWQWGDALFIVLDPFWYTTKKPASLNENWNWTLGREQYKWFKNVLENNSSKYTFVFSHHLVGGSNSDARGGTEAAAYFEWGGLNTDGSYGFDKNRPGWGKPIHQLMVENHVTAFFHGHDHFFDKQELDGIIYQEVPQPGNPSFTKQNMGDEYGYAPGVQMSPAGHLRVSVSDSEVIVDYVRAYLEKDEDKDRKNGTKAYTYTMYPR